MQAERCIPLVTGKDKQLPTELHVSTGEWPVAGVTQTMHYWILKETPMVNSVEQAQYFLHVTFPDKCVLSIPHTETAEGFKIVIFGLVLICPHGEVASNKEAVVTVV